MLKSLRFVQGAVAKKDYVPALTHFHIANGRITGSNGVLTLSSPIALDLDVVPKAGPFVKAVQTCKEDTMAVHMTDGGRLSIRSGRFKAFVDCLDAEAYPTVAPSGEQVALENALLPALKTLARFIAEDASRPWSRGILFRGQSCFATNNICLAEYWTGGAFPVDANIPEEAVQELLRINEEPCGVQVDDRSMTFHYEDGRWLKTLVLSTDWPDISAVLDRPSNPQPIADGFFDAIAELAPFLGEPDKVLLSAGKLATSEEPGVGAVVEFDGIQYDGVFGYKKLMLLQGVATAIDLSAWPEPCMFFGDQLRGAIVGMHG